MLKGCVRDSFNKDKIDRLSKWMKHFKRFFFYNSGRIWDRITKNNMLSVNKQANQTKE